MSKILSILLLLSLGLSSLGLRIGLNQTNSFIYRDRASIMCLTINARGSGTSIKGLDEEMQLQADLRRLSTEFLTEIRTLNDHPVED